MRRKWILALLAALALTGCAEQQTMETVADVWDVPVSAQPRQITVDLPGDAGGEALETASGRLYLGEDYEITLETLDAGDLDATLRSLCGRPREELTVMETEQDGVKRYEFVWAAAGEDGEKLGRGVILDDGSYHYCLTAMRPADPEKTSQIVWSQVFQSFGLS